MLEQSWVWVSGFFVACVVFAKLEISISPASGSGGGRPHAGLRGIPGTAVFSLAGVMDPRNESSRPQ